MSYFDYSCDTPVEICDMNVPLSGNLRDHFTEYSYEVNHDLLVFVVDALAPHLNLGEEAESIADEMANYPENTICSALIDSTANTICITTSTTIRYILPRSGFVTLSIYNPAGRKIETLVNESQPAGAHEIDWITEGLPSGIYFYNLESLDYTEKRKIILQK
jgi:hypothetical protein